MAGFTARIDQITFNATLFTRSMENACRDLMKNAAKYWLIQVVNRIPVRTGFLVGAFSGLEDMLGITAPKFGNSLTLRDKKGKYVKRDLKKGYANDLIKHYSGLKNERLKLFDQQDELERRIAKLHKRKAKFSEKLGFSGERHGDTTDSELAKAAKAEFGGNTFVKGHSKDISTENARIDARIQRLSKRYAEVTKHIDRLNRYTKGSRSAVNEDKNSLRGKSAVIRELQDLRKQINSLDAKQKKKQGFDVFNPQVGHENARFQKEYADITKEIEPTNAEKLAALRKRQKLEKRVEVVGTELKRFKIREEKKIFAFKEYYKDGVTKVLKTPRSGVQFATPADQVFQEYDIATKNLLSRLQAQQITQTNFDTRDTDFESSIPKRDDTFDENLTSQVNESFKSSVATSLYKQILQSKSFFSFNFTVNISYYDINDYYRTGRFGQKQMPWASQQAGQIAFYQYLEHNSAGKLPKIEDFVHTSKVTYDGQSFPTELRKDVVT